MVRRCEDQPPEELIQAIDEFNRRDWFECHETVEELWVGEKGELRDFYQGVLQLAVALHHWRGGNFKGAMTLLSSGGACLGRVRPVCQGVDVAGLAAAAAKLHEALSALGSGRMSELPAQLILQVRLVTAGADGEREEKPRG